jgi:hypothetical protein
MGVAVGALDNDNVKELWADFKLWLPNNRAGSTLNKKVISTYTVLSGGGPLAGNPMYVCRSVINYFMYTGTPVITKIRFRATDAANDTSMSSRIRAGAKVIVYGRTF